MDWRCSVRSADRRSTQTKDGPRGCPTLAEVATGKIAFLESGYRVRRIGMLRQLLWHRHRLGADAHADYESATGRGDETRAIAGRKSCSANKVTNTVGEALAGSLGQPAAEGGIRAAGPTGSKDCGVNYSSRARSSATARGAAVDDASRRGIHARDWSTFLVIGTPDRFPCGKPDRQLHWGLHDSE